MDSERDFVRAAHYIKLTLTQYRVFQIDLVFTEALLFQCAIDYIGISDEQNGNVTEVTTHFVDSTSNTPVEGSVIEG